MPRSRKVLMIASAAVLSACASSPEPSPLEQSFAFVVVGDTAYNGPADEEAYGELIAAINMRRPSFTIHVGDTKGAGPCDDAFQQRILEGFKRFDHPVMYTPGDNEWTDCHKPVNGGADPVERLLAIRRIFFSTSATLGGAPRDVAVQSPSFPENRSWRQNDVLFATVHIVGSNNNIAIPEEFRAREAADIAWIKAAYAEARATNAKALVLAYQAELFADPRPDDGFANTRAAIADEAAKTVIPVLLVHGDAHRFVVDRPFYRATSDGRTYVGANVFRLQTFGAPEMGAVIVRYTNASAAPFSFEPLYGRQNPSLSRSDN